MTPHLHYTEFKRRRTSLGLTQDQLAQYLGVQRVTIARWESGEFPISRPLMVRNMLRLAEDDPAVEVLRRTAPRRGRPPKQPTA